MFGFRYSSLEFLIKVGMNMLTSIYAAILGIFLVLLSLNVVIKRSHARVSIGDGNDEQLTRAIRVQANLVEYLPITLILLFLAELNGASALLLNANGIILIFARLCHVIGLSRHSGPSTMRFIGANLTWLVILNLSIWNLIFGYEQIHLE